MSKSSPIPNINFRKNQNILSWQKMFTLICITWLARWDPVLTKTSPLLKCRTPVLRKFQKTRPTWKVTWPAEQVSKPRIKSSSITEAQASQYERGLVMTSLHQKELKPQINQPRRSHPEKNICFPKFPQRRLFQLKEVCLVLGGEWCFTALQMVPNSRANVLFSLRFRGLHSSGACGFLPTYPPHPITNSLTILKEVALSLALSPDTHKVLWRV